jgi:hypothetical protein
LELIAVGFHRQQVIEIDVPWLLFQQLTCRGIELPPNIAPGGRLLAHKAQGGQ